MIHRILVTCLVLVFAITTDAFGLDWSFQRIDVIGYVGWGCSLQLDSASRPHIAYVYGGNIGPRDLRYTKWNGAMWETETIDTGIYSSWSRSLALDANDSPRVVYVDGTSVEYAEKTGASWDTSTVETLTTDVINDTAIRLDSSGQVHLAYHVSYDYGFHYTTGDGQVWSTEFVQIAGGLKASDFVLDEQDRPHVVATSNQWDVYSARHDGASWGVERVGAINGEAWDIQVERDSQARDHVTAGEYQMKKFTHEDGAWEEEFIDSDVYYYSSLDVDAQDNLHMAYINESTGKLRYAINHGGSWSLESVDSLGQLGNSLSMKVDAYGRVHVAYFDTGSADLIYGIGVPEPATLTLLTLGGMLLLRRKKA